MSERRKDHTWYHLHNKRSVGSFERGISTELRNRRTAWRNLGFPNRTRFGGVPLLVSMSALKGARPRAHARACLTSLQRSLIRREHRLSFRPAAPACNETPRARNAGPLPSLLFSSLHEIIRYTQMEFGSVSPGTRPTRKLWSINRCFRSECQFGNYPVFPTARVHRGFAPLTLKLPRPASKWMHQSTCASDAQPSSSSCVSCSFRESLLYRVILHCVTSIPCIPDPLKYPWSTRAILVSRQCMSLGPQGLSIASRHAPLAGQMTGDWKKEGI